MNINQETSMKPFPCVKINITIHAVLVRRKVWSSLCELFVEAWQDVHSQ